MNEFKKALSGLHRAAPKDLETAALWQRFVDAGIEKSPNQCAKLLMKEHFQKLEQRVLSLQASQ